MPVPEDPESVRLIGRGIATAIAPASGITDVQAELLGAIAEALTGVGLDYRQLEPLGPAELATALADHDMEFRQRIVHHMVLGELVLRPIPVEVAFRVAQYAKALDIDDKFVRVARRYAQGAYGLAWMDLQRSGFVEHVEAADGERTEITPALDPCEVDPELHARWRAFEELPTGTLGRSAWEMYDERGFALPGTGEGAASDYLSRHDFVHVLADYGTNLKGELEVFAFIGRADPDPKGFAWLATLVGLFETGYIKSTGFFDRDVKERSIRAPGMPQRLADAIRRGRVVEDTTAQDLFEVDFHALAPLPVEEVREQLHFPAKSEEAVAVGSAGVFDRAGMSEHQRRYAESRTKAGEA